MKKEIGTVLREYRIKAHISVKEISDILTEKGYKASEKTVYSWEGNNSQPSPDILLLLCDIYNIDDIMSAFGYCSNREKNNDILTSEHILLINKYEDLDPYGKELVKMVIDKEHERCTTVRIVQMPTIEKQPDMTLQRMLLQYFAGVSAGTGEFLLDDTFSLMVSIPLTNESRKADYLVATNGDSMEPLYHNGDILIVQKVEAVNIGEVGIFILDEQAYVKQLGDGCLISLNAKYDPIPVGPDGVKCIGKVIGTVDEEDMIVEEENPAFSGNPLEDPDYIKMVEAYQEEYPGMAAEKGMSKDSRDMFDTLKGIVEEDIERRKKQK